MSGSLHPAAPDLAANTVSTLLTQGLARHEIGQISEAIDLYTQVLALDPDQPYALHLLGEIAHRGGKNERAIELIQRALRYLPDLAEAHNNLGAAYQALGRLGEAEVSYRRAIELKPSLIVASNNLATVMKAQGNAAEARRLLELILTQNPFSAEARINLGNLLRESGEIEVAIECYRVVTEQQPGNASAWNNLGTIRLGQLRYDEARSALERAVALDPRSAEAHNNLGNVLRELGHHEEAIACYQRALTIRPRYAQAFNNIGALLSDLSRFLEALPFLRKALDCDPLFVEALLNFGACLRNVDQLSEAIECFDQALALEPSNAKGHNYRGLTRLEAGLIYDGLADCRRAIEINPGYTRARSNYLFGLNYRPDITGAEMLAEHQAFDTPYRALPARSFPNTWDPDRRLRIGYVSPDFKRHSCAFFLEPLLAAHDPAVVEIFCYSDVHLPDGMTQRIRRYATHWRDTSKMRDPAFVQTVLDDRIDIAVDLTGHTAHNRLTAFASRLAPIQISWLGYPCTTGVGAIDYRLTDNNADPIGEADAHHTETLLRLPHTFLCYRPPDEAPLPGPLPSMAGTAFTFGSFNNAPKINAGVIEAWATILRRAPGSRLLLKSRALAEEQTCNRIRTEFLRHGIDIARIELVNWLGDPADHLRLYDRVDLALDPFPYNGTTTTCEALWMGVPVLTLAGQRHAARVGASLMPQVGLPQFVASTLENYIGTAVHLASAPKELANIKADLRATMAASSLCDAAGFARAVEQAYRAVWRDRCSKEQQ